jgi:uncharacterized membrane protein
MKSLTGFLKTTIVGGALYLIPIVVILAVLGKVHAVTSKLIAPMTEALELHDIGGINAARLFAIVAIVLACFAAGLFARTRVAQRFVGWLERAILSNLPGYSLISAIGADFAGASDAQSAMKVVLARIEDAWQLGLLVERVDETHAAVFVPGAPDPKSGSVYLMADDRFKLVDVPIREAMKCIKGLGIGSRALLAGRLDD